MLKLSLDEEVTDLLRKALDGGVVARDEARLLLERVPDNSMEMALLCGAADTITRARFGNVGEVFAQIGINWSHCPLECEFCVLKTVEGEDEMTPEQVVMLATALVEEGANALSLMVTAEYPFERYLDIARRVRAALPPLYPLVANVGDFDPPIGHALAEAGITAVYHVNRLREGVDTKVTPEQRFATLRAAKAAGLDVVYCLEPIGPEHSVEELLEGLFACQQFEPTSLATMRRIAVPATPLAARGEITEVRQAKIEAVATLVAASWPSVMMMSAHEPSLLFLRSGANRVTAEAGVNPRDTEEDTTTNRGRSFTDCRHMVWDAGFDVRVGPSPAVQGPLRR
jgi:biotin synthase